MCGASGRWRRAEARECARSWLGSRAGAAVAARAEQRAGPVRRVAKCRERRRSDGATGAQRRAYAGEGPGRSARSRGTVAAMGGRGRQLRWWWQRWLQATATRGYEHAGVLGRDERVLWSRPCHYRRRRREPRAAKTTGAKGKRALFTSVTGICSGRRGMQWSRRYQRRRAAGPEEEDGVAGLDVGAPSSNTQL